MAPGRERRSAPRLALQEEVMIASGGREFMGWVHDASVNGLRVVSPVAVSVGEKVRTLMPVVRLRRTDWVWLEGVVTRVKVGWGAYELGVRLVTLCGAFEDMLSDGLAA